MKLTDITEKTPLIKDFGARLAKSTKQKVVATVFNKVKRVAGVSAMPKNRPAGSAPLLTFAPPMAPGKRRKQLLGLS